MVVFSFSYLFVVYYECLQSIGIAAAPKFSAPPPIGGFANTSTSKSNSKTNARSGVSSTNPISKDTGVPSAAGVGSRVSAVHVASDHEGGKSGGTWDEDMELDDLIGDD